MFKNSIWARSWEAALCVCRCTCPDAPEPYAAAPTQSTGDFPSPPSCMFSPNPFSSHTAFCHSLTHEPIARVGFHLQYIGNSNPPQFPQERYGFRQELIPGDPGTWADTALWHLCPSQKQPASPFTSQRLP